MSTHGGAESGGVWVRRQADEPTRHRCPFPEEGVRGDLWCCGCGALWRLGDACDWCDRYGVGPHQGQCMVGAKWRPATLRQEWRRIRYRRR